MAFISPWDGTPKSHDALFEQSRDMENVVNFEKFVNFIQTVGKDEIVKTRHLMVI